MPVSRKIALRLTAAGLVLILGLATSLVPPSAAQSAISTDGVIESRSGGLRFPDGSVQEGAAIPMGKCPTMDPDDEMIWVAGVCIDKYEASIWDAPVGGNQITGTIPCSANGQDCDNIWARSVAGVEPMRAISWFQVQAALANSGKRLPTSAEWQIAAAGTPDLGDFSGSEDCNTNTKVVDDTGERENCVSRWGHHDMVGNLREWVADWSERSAFCDHWSEGFGEDLSCIGRADAPQEDDHLPGAHNRGGNFAEGTSAGNFAIRSSTPDGRFTGIGFRGAR